MHFEPRAAPDFFFQDNTPLLHVELLLCPQCFRANQQTRMREYARQTTTTTDQSALPTGKQSNEIINKSSDDSKQKEKEIKYCTRANGRPILSRVIIFHGFQIIHWQETVAIRHSYRSTKDKRFVKISSREKNLEYRNIISRRKSTIISSVFSTNETGVVLLD